MNFVRIAQWWERSECERYTVAAVKVDGKFMFQAWRGSQPLKVDADAEVCRQACRDHLAASAPPETSLEACGGMEGER